MKTTLVSSSSLGLLGACWAQVPHGAEGAEPSDRLSRLLPCAVTGWPPLAWLVIDGKHLTKPPKDWYPLAQDTGSRTAYIEVRTLSIVHRHILTGSGLGFIKRWFLTTL